MIDLNINLYVSQCLVHIVYNYYFNTNLYCETCTLLVAPGLNRTFKQNEKHFDTLIYMNTHACFWYRVLDAFGLTHF